jgi:hypothetical protein
MKAKFLRWINWMGYGFCPYIPTEYPDEEEKDDDGLIAKNL